jgi:hypothetical protein
MLYALGGIEKSYRERMLVGILTKHVFRSGTYMDASGATPVTGIMERVEAACQSEVCHKSGD